MTIPFGRRRLIVNWVVAPRRNPDVPAAQDATEDELLRLAGLKLAAEDIYRWQAYSALYGGFRSA